MELHWRVARGQAPRSWQSLLSGWSVEVIRERGRKEKEDLSVKSAFVFDGWHSTCTQHRQHIRWTTVLMCH